MYLFYKKKTTLLLIIFLMPFWLMSQNANKKNPYGTINPLAPRTLADFEPLMGTCNCKSVSKNQEGFWADTVGMTWTFRYIMDGMAVQDETIKEDGRHSGSIRQYNPDSSKWYVHYYSTSSAPRNLPTWEGGKNANGDIVLYNEQKAPNGTEGFYRLTFSNITEHGYDWIGEWVNTAETFTFPTWKIFCKRE